MPNKNKKIGSLIAACALLTAMAGHALASGPAHMVLAGKTLQPIGHHEYCRQYRADCSIWSRSSEAVELTRERWQELVQVNVTTNREITPLTDLEGYAVEEHWTYPVSFGDCEDYVLLKRKRLMEMGWPASALLITVVRRNNGEGHAVLTVRTKRADYVLDNLDSKIVQWNQSSHKFIKRQSHRYSGRWISIQDVRG